VTLDAWISCFAYTAPWCLIVLCDLRRYHLHVPEGYAPSVPTPLVFDFHAYGWSATDQLETSGLNIVANRRTTIVAYPEGVDDVVCPACDEGSYSWNACGATTWRQSALGPTCQWE
jgi:poly(3-hydroxybutyrate) depolymerase